MSRTDGVEATPGYFTSRYRDYERQNPPRKLDHYLDVVDRLAPQPAALLDIGCGRGAFLERAALRHPEWALNGTDVSHEGIDATQARVPHARLALASAEAKPHAEGSFDVITAWDVVEHVESLDDVASAVDSMLRPGGVFVFVVPVYDGVLGPLINRLDKDPTHIHKEGRAFWLNWAAQHFEVLEWHGIFRYLIGAGPYVHYPTGRLRRQATAVLVYCRRSLR